MLDPLADVCPRCGATNLKRTKFAGKKSHLECSSCAYAIEMSLSDWIARTQAKIESFQEVIARNLQAMERARELLDEEE